MIFSQGITVTTKVVCSSPTANRKQPTPWSFFYFFGYNLLYDWLFLITSKFRQAALKSTSVHHSLSFAAHTFVCHRHSLIFFSFVFVFNWLFNLSGTPSVIRDITKQSKLIEGLQQIFSVCEPCSRMYIRMLPLMWMSHVKTTTFLTVCQINRQDIDEHCWIWVNSPTAWNLILTFQFQYKLSKQSNKKKRMVHLREWCFRISNIRRPSCEGGGWGGG